MSWITVGVVAASALMGSENAKAKKKAQESNNQMQSEITKYSPWTGMSGQTDNSFQPGELAGGIAGGIQGLGMGQSLKGAFGGGQQAQGLGGMDQMNQELGMQPAQQPTFFGRGPSYTA
jgi:hypothetical protein